MMHYFTIDTCIRELFPVIHREMTDAESAADYVHEPEGMQQLEKVLSFVQNDQYYSNFAQKAAYLLCSVAGSQYFSNGNKRLSIILLLKILGLNDTAIKDFGHDGYHALLNQTFPMSNWEDNSNISDAHALFLYNLAIVIGDRTVWGTNDFAAMRERVTAMFAVLYA